MTVTAAAATVLWLLVALFNDQSCVYGEIQLQETNRPTESNSLITPHDQQSTANSFTGGQLTNTGQSPIQETISPPRDVTPSFQLPTQETQSQNPILYSQQFETIRPPPVIKPPFQPSTQETLPPSLPSPLQQSETIMPPPVIKPPFQPLTQETLPPSPPFPLQQLEQSSLQKFVQPNQYMYTNAPYGVPQGYNYQPLTTSQGVLPQSMYSNQQWGHMKNVLPPTLDFNNQQLRPPNNLQNLKIPNTIFPDITKAQNLPNGFQNLWNNIMPPISSSYAIPNQGDNQNLIQQIDHIPQNLISSLSENQLIPFAQKTVNFVNDKVDKAIGCAQNLKRGISNMIEIMGQKIIDSEQSLLNGLSNPKQPLIMSNNEQQQQMNELNNKMYQAQLQQFFKGNQFPANNPYNNNVANGYP